MYIDESCMPPWKKVYTGRDVDKFNARLPMMLLERLLDIDLLGRTRMQRIKVQGDRQMVGSSIQVLFCLQVATAYSAL